MRALRSHRQPHSVEFDVSAIFSVGTLGNHLSECPPTRDEPSCPFATELGLARPPTASDAPSDGLQAM